MRTPHRPRIGRTLAGLLTALLLAAPLACRKPAKPSEAYFEAQTRFGRLYAAQGDDAFVAPALEPIEELLAQVPADSLDAASADALRRRIAEGKQRMLAQRQERDEALAKAQQPTMSSASFDSRPSAPPPSREPEPEAEDAGTDAGTAGGPGVGTPVAELASGFSGCFRKGESLQVQGRGVLERWELSDGAACRQRYASLQEQVMLIENGKVLGLAPKSAIYSTSPDGGPRGPAGDAGR